VFCRLASVLAALFLVAGTVACSSDDTRPTYAYSALPSAARPPAARLPAPNRRIVASPYRAPQVPPRRAST